MEKRDKKIPYEVVIQERKRVDLYGNVVYYIYWFDKYGYNITNEWKFWSKGPKKKYDRVNRYLTDSWLKEYCGNNNFLNELYKEIEKAEIDLNAKRLKYIKEALVENGGSIKLKFKKWGEDNNAFDFDDQFPVIIEIAGIPMFLTEVYVKKNDFRMVLLDYDDMTLGDFDNTGENEQVAYFINYCLNQDKDGKE